MLLRPPRGDFDVTVATKSIKETLASFFLVLKDKRILLLIAFILYSGVEQAFIFVNYPSDIISPFLGKSDIGWVMAVFGAVNGPTPFSIS